LAKNTDWPDGPLGTTAAGVAHPPAVETDGAVDVAVEMDPGTAEADEPEGLDSIDVLPAVRWLELPVHAAPSASTDINDASEPNHRRRPSTPTTLARATGENG
jgi:hypothetical protein